MNLTQHKKSLVTHTISLFLIILFAFVSSLLYNVITATAITVAATQLTHVDFAACVAAETLPATPVLLDAPVLLTLVSVSLQPVA